MSFSDIYGDLDEFADGQNRALNEQKNLEVEKECSELKEKVSRLENEVQSLKDRIQVLELQNSTLARNISRLFMTAKKQLRNQSIAGGTSGVLGNKLSNCETQTDLSCFTCNLELEMIQELQKIGEKLPAAFRKDDLKSNKSQAENSPVAARSRHRSPHHETRSSKESRKRKRSHSRRSRSRERRVTRSTNRRSRERENDEQKQEREPLQEQSEEKRYRHHHHYHRRDEKKCDAKNAETNNDRNNDAQPVELVDDIVTINQISLGGQEFEDQYDRFFENALNTETAVNCSQKGTFAELEMETEAVNDFHPNMVLNQSLESKKDFRLESNFDSEQQNNVPVDADVSMKVADATNVAKTFEKEQEITEPAVAAEPVQEPQPLPPVPSVGLDCIEENPVVSSAEQLNSNPPTDESPVTKSSVPCTLQATIVPQPNLISDKNPVLDKMNEKMDKIFDLINVLLVNQKTFEKKLEERTQPEQVMPKPAPVAKEVPQSTLLKFDDRLSDGNHVKFDEAKREILILHPTTIRFESTAVTATTAATATATSTAATYTVPEPPPYFVPMTPPPPQPLSVQQHRAPGILSQNRQRQNAPSFNNSDRHYPLAVFPTNASNTIVISTPKKKTVVPALDKKIVAEIKSLMTTKENDSLASLRRNINTTGSANVSFSKGSGAFTPTATVSGRNEKINVLVPRRWKRSINIPSTKVSSTTTVTIANANSATSTNFDTPMSFTGRINAAIADAQPKNNSLTPENTLTLSQFITKSPSMQKADMQSSQVISNKAPTTLTTKEENTNNIDSILERINRCDGEPNPDFTVNSLFEVLTKMTTAKENENTIANQVQINGQLQSLPTGTTVTNNPTVENNNGLPTAVETVPDIVEPYDNDGDRGLIIEDDVNGRILLDRDTSFSSLIDVMENSKLDVCQYYEDKIRKVQEFQKRQDQLPEQPEKKQLETAKPNSNECEPGRGSKMLSMLRPKRSGKPSYFAICDTDSESEFERSLPPPIIKKPPPVVKSKTRVASSKTTRTTSNPKPKSVVVPAPSVENTDAAQPVISDTIVGSPGVRKKSATSSTVTTGVRDMNKEKLKRVKRYLLFVCKRNVIKASWQKQKRV